MIKRTALAATLALLTLPASAQDAPKAPEPRATQATPDAPAAGAPQPYTPPDNSTDEAETPDTAAPTAPPITNVPPADPAMQQAAEALATQIEDVQVVGPWTDGDRNGIWRTVMMQVGGKDKDVYRFFVQQLDRVGPGSKVLTTTEVKEVAGVDGAVVGYRAEEPEEGDTKASSDLTLFFDVVPSNGEVPESYELHFLKDLTYTFGPASN